MKLETHSAVASSVLQDWDKVGLPLSEPPCRLRGTKMQPPDAGAPEVGVWECSPGRYRRQVLSSEVMHVTAGEATFTPDGGQAIALRAGDLFFFSAKTTGVWDISATLRKVYVILEP